jgi:tetratricopeptide (TPR) repeat protein
MKAIRFIMCLGLFASGSAWTIYAQNQMANSAAPATSVAGSRVQDKLNGQVRRVRVEIANLVVKEGKTVEGSRVVREISTYDQRGQKIDSIVYPVNEHSVVGKTEYLYESRGNVIEMVLRGDDGSILNKEKFDYQFDEFGNWKKMTASVALYENGIVSYEPIEITYRTITYYFGQPAPKAIPPAVIPQPITSTTASATGLEKIAKPTADPVSGPPPSIAANVATSIATSDAKKSSHASEAIVIKPEKSAGQPVPPSMLKPKEESVVLPAKQVVGALLKSAAIDLPKTQHPRAVASASGSESRPNQGTQQVSELKIIQPATFSETNVTPTPTTPEPELSFYDKGVALLEAGQNGEAAEALRQATQRNPNAAAAYLKLGIAYAALGQHAEGIAVLKMSIRIKPEIVDAEGYYQLSNAYAALGKFSNALEAIKQAIYVRRADEANREVVSNPGSPSLANLHYAAGLVNFKLHRFSAAIEELNQALGLDPKKAQTYYGLALAYIANGDRRSAEKQLEILDALDPVYAAKIAKLLSSTRPNQTQSFGAVFKTSQ